MPVASVAAPDTLTTFLTPFRPLFGDARSYQTFGQICYGILAAGSLVAARIAAHAPALAPLRAPSQPVLRFATGDSTQRSTISPATLTATLAQRGATALTTTPPGTEIWLVLDGSDLRKPHSRQLPDLMRVRALDGRLVPGSRTLNILGITPQHRTLLYHRLFSSQEPGFASEPHETQTALQTVGGYLVAVQPTHPLTWLMDRGFDDVAVWRTVWEQDQHLVCRVQHTDRLLTYRTRAGRWVAGHLADALPHLRQVGTVETIMEVRLRGQKQAKRQPVTVLLRAGAGRVSYDPTIRRPTLEPAAPVQQAVWLVEVTVVDSPDAPWLLLTDWPVRTAAQAARVFQMYRQRWAVEDAFAFLKSCVGWEDVQVLDLAGIRLLVALGWVVAGFLYEIGGEWEWADVELLARLGGWAPHKDRKPGKKVLLWGLQRVLDWLLTSQWLAQHTATTGGLPPGVAALIQRWGLPEL